MVLEIDWIFLCSTFSEQIQWFLEGYLNKKEASGLFPFDREQMY